MDTDLSSVLGALGDPTRQHIVARLAPGPMSVGDLAAGLPVSRPAVSIHLRVLADAGLVTFVSRGTRNLYSLDPNGLAVLRSWLDDLLSGAPAQPSTEPPPRTRTSGITLLG